MRYSHTGRRTRQKARVRKNTVQVQWKIAKKSRAVVAEAVRQQDMEKRYIE